MTNDSDKKELEALRKIAKNMVMPWWDVSKAHEDALAWAHEFAPEWHKKEWGDYTVLPYGGFN